MEEHKEKEPWWKSTVKYFLHGISFSLLLLVMSFVWGFLLLVLVAVGLFLGLIIGFILLLFIVGGLNSFLTDLIWDVPIKTGWKSLLTHGFVLFIALLIADIPAIIINLLIPSLATTVVMFIVYAFIGGFIAKNVGLYWEEEDEEGA